MKYSKLSVGFVNNYFAFGGAETVVRQLFYGYKTQGIDSKLYLSHGKSYPNDKNIIPLCPRLLSRLDHSRFHRLVNKLANRFDWTDKKFASLAYSDHSVLHIHNFHGDYASLRSLSFLALHKPVIWTFHGFWGITGGCGNFGTCSRYLDRCGECPRLGSFGVGPIDNTSEQLLLKKATIASVPLTVVVPSLKLCDAVSKSPLASQWNVVCIPNGVETDIFDASLKRNSSIRIKRSLDPDAFILLVVNRNFKDISKGYPVIENVLREVGVSGLQVVLVGNNSEWAASRLPDQRNVRHYDFIERREELAELYSLADIFLFASPDENFPCVILEAMAAGCCVVSTPTDGVVEQIEDGVSGLLSSNVDAASLAKALAFALADKDLAKRLGLAAQMRVKKYFSISAMIDQYLDLSMSLLPSSAE